MGRWVVVVLLVSVSPRHIWGACKIYSAAKKGERKGEKKIKKEGLQIKSGGSLADYHSHARAPAPCRDFVPDYKYPSVV